MLWIFDGDIKVHQKTKNKVPAQASPQLTDKVMELIYISNEDPPLDRITNGNPPLHRAHPRAQW